MTNVERCELTELPVSQCPCEHCWPEVETELEMRRVFDAARKGKN